MNSPDLIRIHNALPAGTKLTPNDVLAVVAAAERIGYVVVKS